MRKLQERAGQFTITIPRDIVILAGWKKGDSFSFKGAGKDKLVLVRETGGVRMTKMCMNCGKAPVESAGALYCFNCRKEQEAERKQ